MSKTSYFASLIPELSQWNDGRGIAAGDWIRCVGNYELAVGYSLIFWPEFVEFDGYVLLAGFEDSAVKGFEEATKGDRRAVEAVLNHIHIADLHSGDDVNPETLRYLGRTLRSIYEAKLRADFPARSFKVVFSDEPGLDLDDYELTFWQD